MNFVPQSRLTRFIPEFSAGYLILMAVLFSLISQFYLPSVMIAALLFWLASFKLRKKISPRNARQSLILVAIGIVLSIFSFWQNQSVSWLGLLRGNVGIVAMLVGVSFLTLISQPKIGAKESLPKGKRTIISTFLGVHLFGAVINVSSIFIHADRLSANRALSRSQIVVLTRGFSTAAFWSPFFGAMAVALSYAPSANLAILMLVGAIMAASSLFYTFFEVKRLSQEDTFYGYPLRLSSLYLPSLLTVLVFVVHYFYPSLSVLFIITLSAPLLCLLILSKRKQAKDIVIAHVEGRVANMHNEIVLFLSAGVFGFGLQAVLANQSWFAPFAQFDAIAASICFLIIIGLSMIGFHMLIGISIIAPIALPLAPDPTLLAFIFLASWAIGAAVGPLSGMNISIQGTYNISSQKILRWNFRYAVLLSSLVVGMIFVLDFWVL